MSCYSAVRRTQESSQKLPCQVFDTDQNKIQYLLGEETIIATQQNLSVTAQEETVQQHMTFD